MATTAYEMKRQWDELVAAKQAEREQIRLEELEEQDEDQRSNSSSSSSSLASGRSTPHLVPQVIVTRTEKETDKKERVFEPNSKQKYAEISKKLALETVKINSHESKSKDDIKRQNWRNKEIKVKVKDRFEEASNVAEAEEVTSTFSKTYSFRNLPKGNVAKLQQRFEDCPQILPASSSQKIKRTKGRQILKLISEQEQAKVKEPLFKAEKPVKAEKPIVPIRAWTDVPKENKSLMNQLDQPGSRHGFHASTPSLSYAIENSIEDSKPQFDETFVTDYLDTLRERRDRARRENASKSLRHFEMSLSARSKRKARLICNFSDLLGFRLEPSKAAIKASTSQRTRERYFAFENVDLSGRVISWTEIISVHSCYDVSISEPVFV